MAKIIKASESIQIEPFKVESFSATKRGEESFNYESFSELSSVQDIVFRSRFTPGMPIEEHNNFVISEPFEEVSIPETVKVPESQKELLEKNAEVTKLTEETNTLKSEIAALKAKLEEESEALPAHLEKARQEAYDKGKADAEKSYKGQQADYAAGLAKFYSAALSELNKLNEAINEIDTELPCIVLDYVKEIIGTERRLNDTLILNIVSTALSRLNELKDISFTVNPEDAFIMETQFRTYPVDSDPTLEKGAVRIKTRVGEIDLTTDSLLKDLKKQINEKFGYPENYTS